LQRMVTNDVSLLTPNRAQYSFMCNESGGTIDDFLIYMMEENHYLLVVNAANTEKDYAWLIDHKLESEEVNIVDDSDKYALLAVQGPLSAQIIQRLTNENIDEIKAFSFKNNVEIKGLKGTILLSRTGYTGEDGFEIYLSKEEASLLWNNILEAGQA